MNKYNVIVKQVVNGEDGYTRREAIGLTKEEAIKKAKELASRSWSCHGGNAELIKGVFENDDLVGFSYKFKQDLDGSEVEFENRWIVEEVA